MRGDPPTHAMTAAYVQQDVLSSDQHELLSSHQDPLNPHVLPFEVASHIMDYIPPRTLVRVCMMVSRGWWEFLSEPSFWKSRMKQAGSYYHGLDHIKDIQWPKLCIYSVYEPNWIKSFSANQELSLEPWTRSSESWDRFKISSPRNVHGRSRYDQWSIEESETLDLPRNKEVFRENNGCLQNYVTSYSWSCRDQIIELSQVGLSDGIMDDIRPAIAVSEWFSARWDCGSIFNIRVELLGGKEEIIGFFEDSKRTEQWKGGELGWRKVMHVFRDYGPGVRYIRFADAGKDTQFWAGDFGAKMAAAWVRVVWDKMSH